MNSIDLSGRNLPPYSKWIGSILQIIVDRDINDCYTQEPLWTKVYPQKDGVPVYNPSGKYWVKLYHKGRLTKVTIDDKFPITFGTEMYAKCENKYHIWPQIFSKAICKLNQYKWEGKENFDFESLVGDGSVMYSLTGLIPETLEIPRMLENDWDKVQKLLDDDEYLKNSSYVCCFSRSQHNVENPSNVLEKASDIIKTPVHVASDFVGLTETQQTQRVRGKTQQSPNLLYTTKNIPHNLITGFAYSVLEGFANGRFNMAIVEKRKDEEIRLREALLVNQDQVQKHRYDMNKQQLIESKKERRALKQKINSFVKSKHQLILKPAISYNMLRVKTQVKNVPDLNVLSKYDAIEISQAKKCVINGLTQPPGFSIKELKLDNRSVFSKSKKSGKGASKTISVYKEIDDEAFEGMKLPIDREEGGIWVMDDDFQVMFHYIQVYHDPKTYECFDTFEAKKNKQTEYVYDHSKEFIVVDYLDTKEDEKSQEQQAKEKQSLNLKELINKDKKDKKELAMEKAKKLKLLFGLNRFSETKSFEEDPYFIVQKFDVENYKSLSHYRSLKRDLDSDLILIKNEPQVFKIQAVSKIPYKIWVACDAPFKLQSYGEYLVQTRKFKKSRFKVEYLNLSKNKYHVFSCFYFKSCGKPMEIACQLTSSTQKSLLKYLRLKVQKVNKKEKTLLDDPQNPIVNNEDEQDIPSSSQMHFYMNDPDCDYKVMIEGCPPKKVETNNFDVTFYSSNNIKDVVSEDDDPAAMNRQINKLKFVEPLRYTDKYVPYKYGEIMKERLFVSKTVQAVICFRVFRTSSSESKEGVKGKKVDFSQPKELTIKEKRFLTLRIYNGDKLLYHAQGMNTALLSDVTLFRSRKSDVKDYRIEAKFDLNEWPEAADECPSTKGLKWSFNVYATDNVLVVKDTRKQDFYNKVKAQWEEKNPGRAELASRSRQRYLIVKKQERGEDLNEDEIELIKVATRRSRGEKGQDSDQRGARKTAKKDKKGKGKAGKGSKSNKQDDVVQVKKKKKLPKSSDHNMGEISRFLKSLEFNKLRSEMPLHQGQIKERSDEDRKAISEAAIMAREDALSYLIRSQTQREYLKIQQKTEQTSFQAQMDEVVTTFRTTATSLNKEREVLREQHNIKRAKEEELYTLINSKTDEQQKGQEVIDYNTIKKFLDDNKKLNLDPKLLQLANKVRINRWVEHLIEQLKQSLESFDADQLKTVFDEVKKNKILLHQNLVDEVEDMLEDAEGDDEYQQNKLQELKKAGKGKRKK